MSTPRSQEELKRFWHTQAARVAFKTKLGWAVTFFLGCAVVISVLGAIGLLLLRKSGAYPAGIWPLLTIGYLVCGIAALLVASKRALSSRDALVRLDSILRLDNQLTSADAGVGKWPEPPDAVKDDFGWRIGRVLMPLLVSAALLCGATFIPIRQQVTKRINSPELPHSLQEVEKYIDVLEESDIADQESVEKLKQQLNELESQPEEEWYDHSSLEAAEALRKKSENAAEELLAAAKEAESVLSELGNQQQSLSKQAEQQLQKELDRALQDLKGGELALSEELMNPLDELRSSELKGLSPEQLKSLKEALKKRMDGAESRLGEQGLSKGQGQSGKGEQKGKSGQGENFEQSCQGGGSQSGMCGGESSEQDFGNGGISRGPGEAPLKLEEKPPQFTSNLIEGLPPEDTNPEDSAEQLGVIKITPDPVKEKGITEGGGVNGTGSGGKDVWKGRFTPEEQGILRKYFE